MSSENPTPAPRPSVASRLRRLDGRTVAICVVIALIAALAAGLLAATLGGDDTSDSAAGSDAATLTPRGRIDATKALATGLISFDGQKTTLADQLGGKRPTVVNFFSTTCTPCITEMPAFQRVHRDTKGVSFVGIDVQDQVGPGRKLIKRTGITYEALRDPPGDLLRAVGGVGLPTTLLIDAKGRVVETHTGALSERALRGLIKSKLSSS